MANETTTTTYAEIIPTEVIPDYIQSFNYPKRCGLMIARRFQGTGSVAYRLPRFSEFDPTAGTKTEGTGAFTRIAMDTAEESVPAVIVGNEIALTREVIAASGVSGVERASLDEVILAMDDRRDADILGVSTSWTNTTGSTADVFTRDKLSAALSAYLLLNITEGAEGTALVLHADAFRDLAADDWLSSASTAGKVPALATTLGYMGQLAGSNIQLFVSNNIPAEAPGWSNFMTPIGTRSGLAYVESAPMMVESPRAEESVRYQISQHWIHMWYGTGMSNRNNGMEIRSRT